MRAAQALVAILCLTLVAATASADPVASEPRGFTPGMLAQELKWERIVNDSPSVTAADVYERALASEVHRMGSAADYRTAVYVRDRLAAAGWDARIVEYEVAIAVPTVQRLEIVAPQHQAVNLYEAALPGDLYSKDHAAIGKPFAGYSFDGDVTGPVVYANYGLEEDYKRLTASHVAVRGALVVVRNGKGSAVRKGRTAVKYGAKALLIFNDPSADGYLHGEVYPNGPWRPSFAAMRRTLGIDSTGDPTAIGVPVPGAPHKPFSSLPYPRIPISPITADVAMLLLARNGGPPVPFDWHGGLPIVMHVGGGALRARFVLQSHRYFGPIWDVIAELKGAVKPDEMVITGGHRDAWTYGAVDPISGTVDLLQLGDAFGKLAKTGWRPYRTVVIGSWDGEEVGLFGSAAWVQQHEAELRAGCVAYINTDEVAFGPTFGAGATPDLAGMLHDVSFAASAPDGRLTADYWRAQDPKMKVDDIGGGSDHEPFVFMENLPAGQTGYFGAFGTYHSAYDDIASLKIFDPGMKRAVAAARYTSLTVLRLAGAPYPDLRLSGLSDAMATRVKAFAAMPDAKERRAAVAVQLQPLVDSFAQGAAALDKAADDALSTGDVTSAASAYARLRAAEAAFHTVKLRRGSDWQHSLLYGVGGYVSNVLPTLDDTLDAKYGDEALGQLSDAFAAALRALANQ
ncbi:MAG TPA: M28 family peptidase [Candidatus Tumulicola sp.]|nr:M28 family peptidase [Candidatus Tumulicola sp.]